MHVLMSKLSLFSIFEAIVDIGKGCSGRFLSEVKFAFEPVLIFEEGLISLID
jgi:hypothetical protein